MDYKTALQITYNFTHNNDKKSYHKSEEEMKNYGEACKVLKTM